MNANKKSYITLVAPTFAEVIEKKSKFLAYATPVFEQDQAMAFLQAKKDEHFGAQHHVFAYKLHSGQERFSDDGEPHGTAGGPVLRAILQSGLEGVAVVVVRYFGGTLLGTGGLARAYGAACELALREAVPAKMVLCASCYLECDYSQLGAVAACIARCGGKMDKQIFAEAVRVQFHFPADAMEVFAENLAEYTAGKVQFFEKMRQFLQC